MLPLSSAEQPAGGNQGVVMEMLLFNGGHWQSLESGVFIVEFWQLADKNTCFLLFLTVQYGLYKENVYNYV